MFKALIKLLPVGCILIIWLIFSWQFWIKGLVPFPSNYLVSFFAPWQYFYKVPSFNAAMPDVLAQLYPWRHLVVEAIKNGQFPLWNPYLFSGTPLLANFQSAAFSPLNFLFFTLPFSQAWSLLVLLQPLLAGIFTFILLREFKISRWGSLIGAISFSLCGFMVVWMAYGTLSLTIVWLPLLIWAIEKNFRKISLFSLSVISISLAFAIFSGHFQTSLYVALTGILFAFFKFWQTKTSRPLFLIIVFFLLGIILALPQIIPSMELYSQSVRGISFKQTEVIPPNYLVTLLAPDFFGNPTTQNNWFGHYAEWAGFVGVWPLLLGIFSFFGKKKKEILFFFILGIIALIFSLKTPVAEILIKLKIPVLSTSAASRSIVIFSFCFSVLSGFGTDRLISLWDKKGSFKHLLTYFMTAGFIFLFLWILVLITHVIPADKIAIARRNLIFPSLIFAGGSILFLGGFWLKRWKNFIIMALIVLIAFDLLRFAKKWLPFEAQENLYPQLTITKFLQKEVGVNRVFGNFGNELAMMTSIPSIEGYDPLYLRRYKELITASGDGRIGDLFADRSTVLLEKNGKYSSRLLSLLGVKYILYAKDDGRSSWVFPFWTELENYELIYDGPKYQVLKNKNALPRAFLVGSYEKGNDNQKIIDRLLNVDFNLREKIVLEENLGEEVSSGSGEARITNYTPNNIKIEVDSSTAQLLFLSDNYYPGWRAKLDGEIKKIYRADYTFRAVFVPEGRHLVEFTYDPPFFKPSLILSGTIVIFLVLLNGVVILKRKK